MEKKNNRIGDIVSLVAVLAITMTIFIYLGQGKRIIFCDEVYTYTITNSDRFLYQFDLYTMYHGDYIDDKLCHDASDSLELTLSNVKTDKVHPPFYYIVMYIASCMFTGKFSIWTGLLVNFIFIMGTAALFWLVLRRIFSNGIAAAFMTVLYVFNLTTLSDMMLIRMYMAYTFWVALFKYFNIRFLDGERSLKTYLGLVLATFGGFMTQYYFALFAIGFFVGASIICLIEKKYKDILKYLASMVGAVGLSTIVWRSWIDGIFNNSHSGAMEQGIGDTQRLLHNVADGVKLMMTSVFPYTYKYARIIIPVLIICFIFSKSVKSINKNIKKMVISMLTVSVVYAMVVRCVTPDYLNSTRYYYAAEMMFIMSLVTAVFSLLCSVAAKIRKVNWPESTTVFKVAVSFGGMVIGLVLYILSYNIRGMIIDYYIDSDVYDNTMASLDKYSDIPWLIFGGDGWVTETNIFDYGKADNFMLIDDNFQIIESDVLNNADQFIVAGAFCDDNNTIVLDNSIYYFQCVTGKWSQGQKILQNGMMTYYLCTVTENNDEVDMSVLDQYVNIPWIIWGDILYNSKIYDFSKIKKYVTIDSESVSDSSGIFNNCREFIIVGNLFESPDVQDNGLYYFIASTGKFAQAKLLFQKDMIAFYHATVVE